VRAKVTLMIGNPGLTRAMVLDANGNSAAQAKLTKIGQRVQLTFPDSAMYVVLQ
jgi:ATP phosphoribosyltransferase regulatory subunit HisZ